MNLRQVTLIGFATAALILSGCSVEQTREARVPDVDVSADAGKLPGYKIVKTEEGRMPTVDVDAKGGQMPEFDVDVADVEVSTEEKKVDVPKPIVVVEEEDVDVPDVDVKLPKDNEQSETVEQ